MSKRIFKGSLLATTVIASLAYAAPAFAQDEQPSTIEPEDVVTEGDAIVVTGSRIVRPDLTSSSPLAITSAQEIQETGLTRLEDVLNTLPQVEAAQTAFISNGATGTATLDLRGLGSVRTLVLVNGRRLQPGSVNSVAGDINQIPGALVQRIDVTTGGASSVYGADAVAGVVNFIMNKDFEGVQLDAGISYYMHDNGDTFVTEKSKLRGFEVPTDMAFDGRAYHVDLTVGAPFGDGRGHAVAYASWRKIGEIFQGDRDHSACALNASGTACGGSGNAPVPNFYLYTEDFSGYGGFVTLDPDNNIINSVGNVYNFAPVNYFQRPDERYALGAFVDYEISDSVHPYAELMFMSDRSVAQIAESGTFFNDFYSIPCNSPLLTPTQQQQICVDRLGLNPATDSFGVYIGKRNVEGGGRQNIIQHDSYRMVTGTKGSITDNWSYDAFVQYGQSSLADAYVNDFYGPNIFDALNVTTDASGNLVCADPSPSNTACVPYLVFQRGGITPEAAATLSATGERQGVTKEFIASGYVTGDLGFGIARDPIAVVLGAEYRKEIYDARSDYVYENGLLLGQGGPTPSVSGSFDVKELFTEANIPLVQDASFAKDLNLELGYRFSHYRVFGGGTNDTHTYKAQVNWEVNDMLRFRGGYNKAVRAPNAPELFTPSNQGLWAGTDPCSGPTPVYTQAQCALTGVTAAQYGNVQASPAAQYNAIYSGNANLKPEKADTWTIGGVVTPTRNSSISVDLWNIKMKDVIGVYAPAQLLEDCAFGVNPAVCDRINRGVGGSLWLQSGFINLANDNLASRHFRGVDVSAGYKTGLGAGSLTLGLSGTYMLKKEFQDSISTDPYDCVGTFSELCFASPEWRHTFRASYKLPNVWTFSGKWRFMSEIEGPAANGATSIPAYSWFDLAATADIGEHYSLTLGANNILDKNPPLVGGAYASNGNTYAGFYDTLGRYVFAEATIKF